ncbi:MAG: GNAT family N-acetyltransferase [Bacteroidota bacterium]
MEESFHIRKAAERDIPFLVESVIAAEKSGTETLSYSTIFNISEEEVKALLSRIFEEDIPGQELCISGFLIAEINGEYAGAVSAWVEGVEGPSTIIKANMLSFFLGKEKVANATTKGTLLNTVHIEREIGALQLESVYTCNKFRGQGVSGKLIEEHIRLVKKDFTDVKRAQILLAKTNNSAYKAYHKPGFYTVLERKCTDAAILDLLPADTMILMQKEI